MKPREAYNQWAQQYDTNQNKTRDLEGQALRETLTDVPFNNCLEIGCGTGKNTVWLLNKAAAVTAVDLSEGMLAKAQEKVAAPHVRFVQADILDNWSFGTSNDLVTFSLVLEHIEDLKFIFLETAKALAPGGHVYVGELHPFKQYTGTKARFDTAEGQQVVECYTHHISDFTQAAKAQGLELVQLQEYFDQDDRTTIPRILTLLLKKLQ